MYTCERGKRGSNFCPSMHESDILELAIGPECDASDPVPGKRVMPAAKRTYDLFWLNDQDEYVKAHFGFTSTSYCDEHAE